MRALTPSGILAPVLDWFFPPVCTGCSRPVDRAEQICDACWRDAFETLPVRVEASVSGVLLPAGVVFHDALWRFHKHQLIQDVLHGIKYSGWQSTAVLTGRRLGRRLAAQTPAAGRVVLVPVPLHPRRQRQRGYNQAEEIARGVAAETGWDLLPPAALRRVRHTKTQTGFRMEERQKNLASAFALDWSQPPYDLAVIIDDVFTTGATVFELHRSIHPALAPATGIATLALA